MDAGTLGIVAIFIGSSLRLAMPMLLGAIGELVSERAGVLNLSVEGMMLLGAFAGAMGSLATGSPLAGLAVAVSAVLPVALLQAWLSVTLGANQIVSGLGLNVLALGATTVNNVRDSSGSIQRDETRRERVSTARESDR